MNRALRLWMGCAFVWLMFCKSTTFAESDAVKNAIQCLSKSRPLVNPPVEMNLVDQEASHAAKQLFTAQMKALKELDGIKNPAVIPVLIPYLRYTPDLNLYVEMSWGHDRQ